jgi:hypothetical protein
MEYGPEVHDEDFRVHPKELSISHQIYTHRLLPVKLYISLTLLSIAIIFYPVNSRSPRMH